MRAITPTTFEEAVRHTGNAVDATTLALRNSGFLRRGGFSVLSGLLPEELRRRLLREALAQVRHAEESYAATFDDEEHRGGAPARRFLNAACGELLAAFGEAREMVDTISDVIGVPLTPSGRGTYSFYGRPGDYIGIHRDIYACDIAVIGCLHDAPRHDTAGLLCMYPGRVDEKLSSVRRHPERGVVGVRLEPGQTLVIAGGMVPHTVLPVAERQIRIVAICCYRGCFRTEGRCAEHHLS
jgi:hypothetical protein